MGATQSVPSSPDRTVLSDSDSTSAIVPVVFKWSGRHAHCVYVTGSWDGWTNKIALARTSGTDFSAILSLPVGYYQYKFIVDGNWQHSPTLPSTTDAHGNLNNVVEVKPYVPEYDVDVGEDKAPPSPRESYDFSFMPAEDLSGEPPELPFSLGPVSAVNRAINFTRLDHLFVDNADDSIMSETRTMSVMERYNDSIIRTTHIYPRRRPKPTASAVSPNVSHESFGPLEAHVFR